MKHTSAASLTEIPPFAPGSGIGRSFNRPSSSSASMPSRPFNSAASTMSISSSEGGEQAHLGQIHSPPSLCDPQDPQEVAAERGQAVAAGVELNKQKNVSRGQLLSATQQKLVSGWCIDMLINMLYNMHMCYIIRVKNGVIWKNCYITKNRYITCYITVFGWYNTLYNLYVMWYNHLYNMWYNWLTRFLEGGYNIFFWLNTFLCYITGYITGLPVS